MSKRILVIGDAILDRHIYGSSCRISPESSVPVVDVTEKSYTLGGAANVAAQIAIYSVPTFLMYKSFHRKFDSQKDILLRKKLSDAGIKHESLQIGSKGSVTVKTRVWSGNQQIVRFDEENIQDPSCSEISLWLIKIKQCIIENRINTVVFSDYNKGTLTDEIIQSVAWYCSEIGGIITILDPKRPTFQNFTRLTIIKPNDKEMKEIRMSPEVCSRQTHRTYIINTRGSDSTIVAQDGSIMYKLSTSDQEVVDVCGAGDVHCAVLALKYDGSNLLVAVKRANDAASMSISHRGCYNLNVEELSKIME